MFFRQIFDAESRSYTYLLADEHAGDAIAIDPLKAQATLILAILAERGLHLSHVLRTHASDPQLHDCGRLCPGTGAAFVVGEGTPETITGQRAGDGAHLCFGAEHLSVIATPGITPGCVCYLWQDRLFTGDTLWLHGCAHFPAEAEAGHLYDSVTKRLFCLPDETLVFPGHDFHGRTVSTIGEERGCNPAFTGQSRDMFVRTYRQYPTQEEVSPGLISLREGHW